jgi:predicted acylesterase/phospholipase RssA
VSSNLTRASAVIHRSGLLWEAVRASIAIPGVFSPILFGNDVLVDGGVLNNFPVDVMVRLCEGGPVLGSTVSPPAERPHTYEFGPSISGWRVLWSRINPLVPAMKVPSLVGTVMRMQEITGASQMRHTASLADLVIRPDVRGFSHMDFASYEPIIKIGYEEAREQLAAWPGVA